MILITVFGSYTRLENEELHKRVAAAGAALEHCELCGRRCGVNRLKRLGQCATGRLAAVASYFRHIYEESPIRGTRGSGTIFFGGCNLRCVYCQNYDLSQQHAGSTVTTEELGCMMLYLQELGCHNVNLVSPSHVIPQVLAAVEWAAGRGLSLPLVYNTGGYDSPAGLKLLDGIVDIYMPDIKYQDADVARRLSGVEDYPGVNHEALREMQRQVGELQLDDYGVARRGLLVRHLVLPGGLADTPEAMRFIAQELSPETYVNVMDQYRPEYRARQHPPLDRRITRAEFEQALQAAREAGLHRIHGYE